MPPEPPRITKYKRPPIIERVVSLYAEVPEEIFEDRLESWKELVAKDFPVYEPIKEWLVNVEEKEGIPLFDTLSPELVITPRFSKKPAKENFDWSLRCPRGQVTLNMHSVPGDGRSFRDIRTVAAVWIPRWLEHFSAQKIDKVTMHYVNELSVRTVPTFCENNRLKLGKVIKIFTSIPGEHVAIVPPYDCRATLALAGREQATLHLHVSDHRAKAEGSSVRVDLIANVPAAKHETGSLGAMGLIDWAHEKIIERFEAIFTDEAKASFGLESVTP